MCAIARKLVPMLLHIMQTGEPFDLARWCTAHGVPLPAPRMPRKRRKEQEEVAREASPYRAA
jgi:hypothetical protein